MPKVRTLQQGVTEPDQVTISLFSVQNVKGGVSNFNEQLFGQKANIRNIALKLAAQARKKGETPPFIKISLLLIPDWNIPDNGYANPTYMNTKDQFFAKAEAVFSDLKRELAQEAILFEIEDFYEQGGLTEDEKAFMHYLKANGSNADIIKTRALLNNPDRKHLQIDSNTIIKDFEAFYQHTFGLPADEQHDGFNANQYAPAHISANNKVVYICSQSKMLALLNEIYLEYMRNNTNNQEAKRKESNEIYERVFAPALERAGLVYYNADIGKHKVFYPPVLSKEEYAITRDVVTAINMSWAADRPIPLEVQILKQLAPLPYKDAAYDYASFAYIIKKYCGWVPFCTRGNEDPGQYYENFLKISDVETDLKILKEFYIAALANDAQKLKDAIKKAYPHEAEKLLSDPNFTSGLQATLANAFPNTPKANIITKALFNRTVEELSANPTDIELNTTIDLQNEIIPALVAADKSSIKDLVKKPEGVLMSQILKRIRDFLKDQNINDFTPQHYLLIKAFFRAVEKGANIQFLLQEMALITTQVREFVIKEVKWALEQGNDDNNHFNYVPNRKKLLEIMEKYGIQETPIRRPKPIILSTDREEKEKNQKDIVHRKAQDEPPPPKMR